VSNSVSAGTATVRYFGGAKTAAGIRSELVAVRAGATIDGPLECRLRCGDGSWRWVEVVMTNMLDKPAVRGTVCHLRDVTQRRQDRDRLAQLAEQLETELTSRLVIEQAKGFLACRYGTDPDTTFEALRRYARNHGHTLDRVARAVLACDLPDLTP
jgi:hypothetical protein